MIWVCSRRTRRLSGTDRSCRRSAASWATSASRANSQAVPPISSSTSVCRNRSTVSGTRPPPGWAISSATMTISARNG